MEVLIVVYWLGYRQTILIENKHFISHQQYFKQKKSCTFIACLGERSETNTDVFCFKTTDTPDDENVSILCSLLHMIKIWCTNCICAFWTYRSEIWRPLILFFCLKVEPCKWYISIFLNLLISLSCFSASWWY